MTQPEEPQMNADQRRLRPGFIRQALHFLTSGICVHPRASAVPKLLLTLSILLVHPGCASMGGDGLSVAKVTINDAGTVYLGEERVLLAKLPKELKAYGARRATAIEVEVPASTSPAYLRQITETLVAGGYPRIIFTKPLKKEATVEKK
jgi:hypothetical protein